MPFEVCGIIEIASFAVLAYHLISHDENGSDRVRLDEMLSILLYLLNYISRSTVRDICFISVCTSVKFDLLSCLKV